ncbi:hypothetical protein PHYBLDRAFT_58286 [Phycomyces blakesleeanus NRRL 1555(-)]|uniref:Uncharacterized protein n=1 Tax=Phycomyces blakesleeanus (strain ATCC 8743b / DSM 1359 / FGSC 10004 / NBRC 33097 / NRRL 1555) TaxID=763407 RepID=A0A167Q7V4_PHYB8|nr:hypothetical protein PHYBLDRAFT_58286 [Phycomyces blakesleeanus NRRL 1555(-)]OAD79237.1 hypothetical protein PHYBLDRAFT_58286 [Phycomyces blakesleeanus NRRL 1555(-)]|eukprot:XP_018297277.1 hypothetical protein PHYBLDRAFT_58286 [Phycomyces blakesleeanus NRRL 1555(-)]
MATKDEWNPLVEQAANELAERWNIQKTAIPILAEMDKVTLTCNKQVHATSETIQKARKDTADTQTMIQSLREQDKALQLAFDRIDQLESIIQTVKDTYNKVAESVDTIEKAISFRNIVYKLKNLNHLISFYYVFQHENENENTSRSDVLRHLSTNHIFLLLL